jgi:hypothetical protein
LLLRVGLCALNVGLLLASLARSRESPAAAASHRSPRSAINASTPSPRGVPNLGPTWSALPCEQQLANEKRQLVMLQRLTARELPLPVRFGREPLANPTLGAEVADVLRRLGAIASTAPECRGLLCRIQIPAAMDEGFRMGDWARRHVIASTGALAGQDLVLFFQTRDLRTDGHGFLVATWQAFVSTGLPARCWASATGSAALNVVLELIDEESQPAGPPRLTAHYYGPGVGDGVLRCVAEGLDRHLSGASVAEALLPARLLRRLPRDL